MTNRDYIATGGDVLAEDAPHLWGWRYNKTFTVDGVEYKPHERHIHTGPMFKFKIADGDEGWHGEMFSSNKGNLASLKIAFTEYEDLEWNPDLRF